MKSWQTIKPGKARNPGRGFTADGHPAHSSHASHTSHNSHPPAIRQDGENGMPREALIQEEAKP